jgi:hypothetical protein
MAAGVHTPAAFFMRRDGLRFGAPVQEKKLAA